MTSSKIVDSDSHILEPADLWEKNLEPKYRSRAFCIRKDEEGLDYVSKRWGEEYLLLWAQVDQHLGWHWQEPGVDEGIRRCAL